MKHRRLVLLFAALAVCFAGCLQTRHVEANGVSRWGDGSACHDAAYHERRWCGFWPFRPAGAEP